ncbi:MAG: hypothetical protein ACI87E_002453 [Mariniblastus sp.]|jgi:hypothetical protein
MLLSNRPATSSIHLAGAILLCLFSTQVTASCQEPKAAQDEIFSGPQVGETIPSFQMKLGFGEKVGTKIDPIKESNGKPLVLIFVHKRSRPAFGLANSVMRYCNEFSKDKLTRGICFLTADPTDTQNWLGKTQRYFPKGSPVGYSTDGVEGPGEFGLNRNVELTVLIADDNQVVANFALIQPGAHVDGPKILAAIAKTMGSKEQPDINQYLPNNQAAQDTPIAIDPGLMAQIKKLNAKQASTEQIGEALTEIETMVKDNKALQRQLGTILSRWVQTKRIDSLGDASHQTKLNEWAKAFSPKMNRPASRGDRRMKPNETDRPKAGQQDTKLTGLLRSVIQKSNTDEQVDAAAKAIEAYVAANPAAAKELGRITNTVVNSDKLQNYGTAYCQARLTTWAKKYTTDQ